MSRGHSRSPQQRLFTGALFTETLNGQLHAFARRHQLRSDVWVPLKAIDTALKPYGVFVLPRAALCDIALASGGGIGDVTASIGTDRVFVNAEQTSRQQLLEHFREFMMANLLPPAAPGTRIDPHVLLRRPPAAGTVPQPASHPLGEYFSAADEAYAPTPTLPILLPDPCWDGLPPFQHPLALNGSPLLGSETARRVAKSQTTSRSWSVYWRRSRAANDVLPRFQHLDGVEAPGRYNPYFCVRYVPHTYTNFSFPSLTAQRMRHRAVAHRYVSRLWLTLRQAEELFGAHLLPERAQDGPAVFCRHFSAGAEATAYYCADQFDDAAGAFPCASEIGLATRGVRVESKKLRAYPLLTRLQQRFGAGESATGGRGGGGSGDRDAGDRAGTDLAMADARRHSELCAHRERLSAIELHGFWSQDAHQAYLSCTLIGKALTRQCLLCDYPRPLFFSHRALLTYGLALRDGEQGVVQTRAPVRLSDKRSWTKGECWFNVAQLEESAAAAELHDNAPVHFLTRHALHGQAAVRCCRAQLARRRRLSDPGAAVVQQPGGADNEWVPAYVLELTGWRLREGARGIPYQPLASGTSFKRFPVGNNFLFQVDDVELSDAARSWLRRYTPVDANDRAFLRGARQLMTLRAFERGYQSTRWLVHPRGTADNSSDPRWRLRPQCAPVSDRIPRPLPVRNAFKDPPSVWFAGIEFVNDEELANAHGSRGRLSRTTKKEAVKNVEDDDRAPDAPLQRMTSWERAMTARGLGMSAEAAARCRVSDAQTSIDAEGGVRDFSLEDGVAGGSDGYRGIDPYGSGAVGLPGYGLANEPRLF